MKNSLGLMKQAGILPKLRLAVKEEGKAPVPTGPHRVTIIDDKIKKGKDEKGNIIDVVHYVFEENGEKKYYEVPVKDKQGELHYLVQRLSEVPEGSEIILEMKKRGMKNYVSVAIVGEQSEIEMDEDNHTKIADTNIDYPTAEEEGINHDDNPFAEFDKE